jgi:hypothetical protein
MRYLAIVDIVNLEATRFLTICLYGKRGYLIDQIIAEYESPQQFVEYLQRIIKEHGQTLDCYVNDKELYAATLTTPGVIAQLKHVDDLKDCKVAVKDAEEVLRVCHEIKPLIPKPKLSAWRKWLYLSLSKITNLIGGNGNYEI